MLILVFLVACGDEGKDTGADAEADADADADTDADTDADADTDTDDTGQTTDPDGDEGALRRAIAGQLDAAEALAGVAASGGLPVETEAGTYLFACLCGDGSWMLAGDHDGWVGAPMERAGDLSWIEVEIPSPDGSLYKFTNGTDWIADPYGRRYGYDDFGQHSIVRATAAHLERWYDVTDGALEPRDLQVWVPDGGQFTHLLLAHDGQNLFDPSAFWGGWRLDESVPAGMLVVGIDNTAARMEEYTHTTDLLHGTEYGGWGDAYADFVHATVRPMMEETYGDAAVVGTMGSSLGGLIAFHIADRYPADYAMAISLSGTMGWGSIGANNPTMIEIYAAAGHRDVALYLDSGGSGTCWDGDGDGIMDDDPSAGDNYCENIQLRDTLAGVGYTFDVDLWHWHEPGAEHNEAAWAARVFRPLQAFADL